MRHRTPLPAALVAALALASSLAAPAFADESCAWVIDRWVCVPPQEDGGGP
jgi:hypothetical protein